ncbi:IS4 family transposase [Longimicrobium sp.]|uniref:IS4 family transposase n=1 Tax=Longimicrobium sp. TaxID=2029185 RepID=UPI002E2FACDF|nr:IS4 family transposase [Longimicrobium sp.]HEX6040304.1 IS4 family transposase [Longimicrobium sp.]
MRADILAEEWGVITQFLPDGWRELARSTGALKRARQVRNADVLLRLAFLYAASGLSLQQAAARATNAGLARISSVALMKRMRSAGPWLREIAEGVFTGSARMPSLEAVSAGRRLRVVDATHVRVSGSSGTDWRLHYVLRLPTLTCDFAEVTDSSGGETYKRVPVEPGDVILGDRGYCHREGVAHVLDHGGDAVVRLNANSFPLLDQEGSQVDLLDTLRSIEGHAPKEYAVRFRANDREYAARLCAVRKSASAAQLAKERLLKAARKKGRTVQEQTLELAEYIFVLATPGLNDLTAEQVLELYRVRWQVELGFKRLKSLFDAGSAPNRDPEAVRSWIYAKLLAVLLIERLGEESRLFSPWGFPLGGGQPMEGVSGGVRRLPRRGVSPLLAKRVAAHGG